MAAQTLTAMPSAIYAGDTLLMLISLGDYPASDGWTLNFTFRAKDLADIDFASTASSSNHAFNITSATTQQWIAGEYTGQGYVSNGTQVFTVWVGKLTVKPDIAAQSNYDGRTHARKCLDSLNAVLENKASKDVLNSTIAGQTLGRMTFTELLAAKSYYESVVRSEDEALLAAQGRASGNMILTRFKSP